MPVDPNFWARLKRLDLILRQRSQTQTQFGVDKTKPQVNPEAIADAAAQPSPAVGVEHIIAEAMKTRTLLAITYKNKERFVEPYKVETALNASVAYNARTSPRGGPGVNPVAALGHTRILWVWDENSIKSFIVAKIQKVNLTNFNFTPRWPIEGIKP